ncbi:triose-phosphate isomerase [Sulfurovum sp. NBC37-1]|uniref:Triosephosphate isomerase n=1 Tax=Sulfurovum sp. (strain NBC37-1) TaxID=387093 RepID=TPIS_SULNB|nr:triose-phosphate isomerase [Sulfurovum sp. NBC37-1]A6QCD3.1 RecName: Full=Triosephosphate isomerase; Short=TIM; Short=TPI; AltName: Full=Triose-phosphate isomerase [Sulfurovum sp. NBC37-1]BAF73142.1 triosephosphate isomerase [Sulfurovum sp. NBC37-1]
MIFAANFKMNHTRASTKAYLDALNQKLASKRSEDRVFVFPPSTALDHYDGDFTIGAQNAYLEKNGAFTGEIGLDQLDEFAIKTILIGHSERRDILGEDQAFVAEKFSYFKSQGFEIIYCIGEALEVREAGEEAVMVHLLSQFEGIDLSYEKMIVAYEPIWAIGTGHSATTEAIASTHAALKQHFDRPLLYGGSVKPANIKEITAIESVDGVLVGSASLEVESFTQMIFA